MKAESIQTQTLIGFRKGSFYVNEVELNELMTDTLDLMLGTTKLQHRKEQQKLDKVEILSNIDQVEKELAYTSQYKRKLLSQMMKRKLAIEVNSNAGQSNPNSNQNCTPCTDAGCILF